MMVIDCPYCGERAQAEFTYERTLDSLVTLDMAPEEALARLFSRANPAEEDRELWRHAYGCRQWLVLRRHRRTHAIAAVDPYTEDDAE